MGHVAFVARAAGVVTPMVVGEQHARRSFPLHCGFSRGYLCESLAYELLYLCAGLKCLLP